MSEREASNSSLSNIFSLLGANAFRAQDTNNQVEISSDNGSDNSSDEADMTEKMPKNLKPKVLWASGQEGFQDQDDMGAMSGAMKLQSPTGTETNQKDILETILESPAGNDSSQDQLKSPRNDQSAIWNLLNIKTSIANAEFGQQFPLEYESDSPRALGLSMVNQNAELEVELEKLRIQLSLTLQENSQLRSRLLKQYKKNSVSVIQSFSREKSTDIDLQQEATKAWLQGTVGVVQAEKKSIQDHVTVRVVFEETDEGSNLRQSDLSLAWLQASVQIHHGSVSRRNQARRRVSNSIQSNPPLTPTLHRVSVAPVLWEDTPQSLIDTSKLHPASFSVFDQSHLQVWHPAFNMHSIKEKSITQTPIERLSTSVAETQTEIVSNSDSSCNTESLSTDTETQTIDTLMEVKSINTEQVPMEVKSINTEQISMEVKSINTEQILIEKDVNQAHSDLSMSPILDFYDESTDKKSVLTTVQETETQTEDSSLFSRKQSRSCSIGSTQTESTMVQTPKSASLPPSPLAISGESVTEKTLPLKISVKRIGDQARCILSPTRPLVQEFSAPQTGLEQAIVYVISQILEWSIKQDGKFDMNVVFGGKQDSRWAVHARPSDTKEVIELQSQLSLEKQVLLLTGDC